ncbi:MAG: hypothetical protein J6K25_07930 [Thermoguttaceae bacterium]|nr:hypothetical protein [Thermoguttaceae bacterium]
MNGKRASIAFGANGGSNATHSPAVQVVKARLAIFLVVADRRDARASVRAEVAQADRRFLPGVAISALFVRALFRTEAAVLRLGNFSPPPLCF